MNTRREILIKMGRMALALPAISLGASAWAASEPVPSGAAGYRLSDDDEKLLEEIARASFRYFWDEASPFTGLVKDRSQANGHDSRTIASMAATGFGLTTLCIAAERGYAAREKLAKRARATLSFLLKRMPHQRGFFFHFVDMHTGERMWNSELSSIDTAILLCGVLTCRQYFDDPEIVDFATKIYERVDWPWMMAGDSTLSMGWKPESGFLKSRWDTYSELMMLYLLAIGSPTHPLSPDTWRHWKRPVVEFEGIRYISSGTPLFTHQFSHAWFDFRNQTDGFADYFENSIQATLAHKTFCLQLAKQFPHYSESLWGITASDSAHGYVAWGGPPVIGPIDGTVVPCAAGGSIPFLPRETMRVLHNIRENYAMQTWKRYSFVDAFNPKSKWHGPDVIGIDLGITMLMAENARTQFVWKTFMKDTDMLNAMKKAAFRAKAKSGHSHSM